MARTSSKKKKRSKKGSRIFEDDLHADGDEDDLVPLTTELEGLQERLDGLLGETGG